MLALIAMVSAFMPVPAAQASVEAKRYLGEVVNAGHDTGYSRNEKITEDDRISDGSSAAFMSTAIPALPKTNPGIPFF